MKKLNQKIKQRRSTLVSPADAFRNESGAIDLASIMVGIIVIGLIGGVIAATVFAVIPWTQDNAAKQQLDSVVSAEAAYMGLSSSVPSPLPVGHKANSYADSAGLAAAGLMKIGPKYCAIFTNEGKGYEAYAASASGSFWTVSSSNTKPSKLVTSLPDACKGTTATALPAVNDTSRLRFGVAVPSGPLSKEVANAAIEAGESPSIISTYKDWKQPFNSAEIQAVYEAGAQPMLTWEPWDASVASVNQPQYSLSTIYNGQHDAYIDSWIASIKAENTPKPILMRFAHEMNGNWYPWGTGVNGNVSGGYDGTNKYATGDYAKAWRYIHDKFEAAGVDDTKVQWIFSSNNTSANGEYLYNYWPGADYVDINGVSGFNWGTTGGPRVWQQPWEVFGASMSHLNNDADVSGKPILITETASAPTEGTNSQSQYITNLVNWLNEPANSNVIGFVYFEHHKQEEFSVTDWRYTANPESSAAMKNALASRPK